MKRRQRLRAIISHAAFIPTMVVLLLATGCTTWLAFCGRPSASVQESSQQTRTSTKQAATEKDPAASPTTQIGQLSKTDSDSGSNDSDADDKNTLVPGGSTSGTSTQPKPVVNCDVFVKDQVNSYNNDLKQAKSQLDSTLSYPGIGSFGLEYYLDEYNSKAKSTYTMYQTRVQQAGCVFPVEQPVPLLLKDIQ